MVRRFAALCLVLTAAQAEVPQEPSKSPPVPQSIWQVSADGAALHLQSGLVCPADVGDFRRTRLHVFDRLGLDVGCNYNGRRGWITIYLTKRGSQSLGDDFAEAKRQLLAHAPAAAPLPDADQKDLAGTLTFQHIVYGENAGRTRSGIWEADLSGWTLEYRATYDPAAEPEMLDEMAELTRRAEGDAGTALARCAKSDIPVRDGAPVTDDSSTMAAALMLLVPGDDGTIPAQDEKGNPQKPVELLKPAHWCAEAGLDGFKYPMLVWHAVGETGQTQPFDRVTVPGVAGLIAIDSSPDLIGSLPGGAAAESAKPQFLVSLKDGDEVYFYALFRGRPDARGLAAFLQDHVDGRGKPQAKANLKTNTLTMFQDPGSKQ